jgi:hypothetical protein
MRYRLEMLLSKKPTVEKPAVEETTRLLLDLSSEPLPYNGVRLTLDLIESRSYFRDPENLTVATSLQRELRTLSNENVFSVLLPIYQETFNLIPGF